MDIISHFNPILAFKKIVSRRKHPRFYVAKNTFIVFQPSKPNQQRLQIIDISEGGCAFIYTGSQKDIYEFGQVDLMTDDSKHIDSITCTMVRDEHISGPFRKRGVEFKWLGSMNKKKLKNFVQESSVCKC
jgi:c-di-GMP-binding flagellar brake protein YcgR